MNHRDCGAAKILNGERNFNKFNESKIHEASFIKMKKIFKKKYPKLSIEFYLVSLNGKLEKF